MFLKKLIAAAMAATIMMCGCAVNGTPMKTASPGLNVSAADSGFSVSGAKLLDANGNEFVMRGINHAHTWYKSTDDTALKAIAETGSNCVRLVLANGIQWDKDDGQTITGLVEKCRQLKMIAVVEVHDGTGSNDNSVLDSIADYWIEVKDALIGSEAYVILNIANEWGGNWGMDKQWGDAYCAVIPRLREAGIKNTVMVDAAGWGQYGDCVAKEGRRVLEADPLSNTMFSIHMYGTAGRDENTIKKNINGALDNGLCLCIGEFGYTHSDGDVKEDIIMGYCAEKGVGYLGWSWKGNSGGVEYLDIAKEWDGSALSADWGEVLINGENGIRKTSKLCTVFD